MNIVDSCGWLEYFADGPNADYFAPVIENTKRIIVPAICVYEVFKRVYQQSGEDNALQAIAVMSKSEIIDLNISGAIFAAKLSAEAHLPMADSIILAVARLYKATIWTQDKDLKGFLEVKYKEAKKK